MPLRRGKASRPLGWDPATFEVWVDLHTSALDVAPGDCFYAGLWMGTKGCCLDPRMACYGGEADCPAGLYETEDEQLDWPGALGQVCMAEAPIVEEKEFLPEPGTMALLATGLAGLGGYAALRWRSRRKR